MAQMINANDIILTKEAIGPNLKHITKCMELLSGYNDTDSFDMDKMTQQLKNEQQATRLAAIKERECELKTKSDELKQLENELLEQKQQLNDKQIELNNR